LGIKDFKCLDVCFIIAFDMKLESDGILLALVPFNERDAVARIFTREYGVLVGMLRGAVVAKKNKPMVGQIGGVVWSARLDSQLGVFHWECERNLAADFILVPDLLMLMNAAFELLVTLLPERESYQDLFDNTLYMLDSLKKDNRMAYLEWEVALLRELGYALDLSRCSGCGCVDHLNYLSPRTARAVCDKCAVPYINKLYKLPLNLNITLRFLENVCSQQGVCVPIIRNLVKNM
jgi:DNA repair protein RecO (recombination protein O)